MSKKIQSFLFTALKYRNKSVQLNAPELCLVCPSSEIQIWVIYQLSLWYFDCNCSKLFLVNAMMVVSQKNLQLSYLQYAVRLIIFELTESPSYSPTPFLWRATSASSLIDELISHRCKSKKTNMNWSFTFLFSYFALSSEFCLKTFRTTKYHSMIAWHTSFCRPLLLMPTSTLYCPLYNCESSPSSTAIKAPSLPVYKSIDK